MIPKNGILVGVDFAEESALALEFAVSMAQEWKTKLYVIHVYEHLPHYDYLLNERQEELKKKVREKLANCIPQSVKKNVPVELILEEGQPVHHTIVEKTRELGVDVIVVGTKGRTGLAHVWIGSVAEDVVLYAPCSVFVVRNGKH